MTQLSPHFSLEELTTTSHRALDNTPAPGVVANLRATALMMEKVRELLGDGPIHVNSGYRSPEVNKAVGGAATSAHLAGYAVDFICPEFGSPIDICRHLAGVHADHGGVRFDQIIEEGTWVHISFDPRLRGEVLTKNKAGGYSLGLPD